MHTFTNEAVPGNGRTTRALDYLSNRIKEELYYYLTHFKVTVN